MKSFAQVQNPRQSLLLDSLGRPALVCWFGPANRRIEIKGEALRSGLSRIMIIGNLVLLELAHSSSDSG